MTKISENSDKKASSSKSVKLGNIRLSLNKNTNSNKTIDESTKKATENKEKQSKNRSSNSAHSKKISASLPTIRLSSKSTPPLDAASKKNSSTTPTPTKTTPLTSFKLSTTNLAKKIAASVTTSNTEKKSTSSASSSSSKIKKSPTLRINLTPTSDGSNHSTPASNSIRANTSSTKNSGGPNGHLKTTSSTSQSAKKKIKFSTVSKPPKISKASSNRTQIWHQRTDLSLLYYSQDQSDLTASPRHIWGYEGTTTMYVTQEDIDKRWNGNTSNKNSIPTRELELGIHLRGSCVVSDIQAFFMNIITPISSANLNTTTNKAGQKSENKNKNEVEEEGEELEKNKTSQSIIETTEIEKEKDKTIPDKNLSTPQKEDSTKTSRSVSPETTPLTYNSKPTSQEQELEEKQMTDAKLEPLRVSYKHFDPLAKVFCAPTKWMKQDFEKHKKQQQHDSNTKKENNRKYEGDNFCQVGGKRMMRSLRVASAASALGELRLVVSATPENQSEAKKYTSDINSVKLVEDSWKSDLLDENKLQENENGSILNALHKKTYMEGNSYIRKMKRINYIAKQLASHSLPASQPTKENNRDSSQKKKNSNSQALKIVIRFHIPKPSILKSSSGIHFMSPSNSHISSGYCAPYVYTSCGTIGDHQGPRYWVPCLDSASSKHRCSHEMSIKVTATREEGISVVGCGEDFGQIDTVTRSHSSEDSLSLYGSRHGQFLKEMKEYHDTFKPFALFATSIFYTSIFTPIPARSLGFAIGPFLSCPDPEYPDDIRQIYLAPLSLRSLLHSSQPVSTPKALHNAVLAGTSGVPLRALSLTREILALPAFRSSTYTQVWLPACIDGGSSSGTWQQCHSVNSWLGGATLDSNLLPPPGHRLPFHAGGRVLQMAQARCAITGWVVSSLPLGGEDDVGQGYIHGLISAQLMEIYERAHGGSGEGGGKTSHFYVERFALGSGLNGCGFLDFLPVQNVEEDEILGGLGSALAVEEKKNEELWRGALNGTESRTSAMDEISIRKTLVSDILEFLERNDESVPLPSPDWQGSYLSLSYLSSNACSSSYVGSGATDLLHPVGGTSFRSLKCEVLCQAISSRAGLANFIRFMRACFIATMLIDAGESNLVLPNINQQPTKSSKISETAKKTSKAGEEEKKKEDNSPQLRPPFVLCVDDIIKKGGITHTLVTNSLRRLAGPIREPYLYGHSHWSLIDISTEIKDQKNRPLVEPEGYPNSYVRGSSNLYLRVGAHIESVGGDSQAGAQSSTATVKGIYLHVYTEPIVPKGGISFAGPITLRVVENEGQCCEYERQLTGDGRREGWGPIPLHARTVTTAKQQNAASGGLDGAGKDGGKRKGCFNKDLLHGGGYQALELIRLTNRSPLLWIRVDPHNQYPGARIHISQPDACLAEQLFHDGDAAGQISALRALAERPTRIQGSAKISNIYDVRVSEMPVRILGDCLRGSVALHSSLPHTPAVRIQAALAIAQWQNNKAPASKDAVGVNAWIGLEILLQYFKERHINNDQVMPVRYTRRSIRVAGVKEIGKSSGNLSEHYQYLDLFEETDRIDILAEAEDVADEEDEEYRVRAAAIAAIASIRAKDGQTPPSVLRFLESILISKDGAALENISSVKHGISLPSAKRLKRADNSDIADSDDEEDFAVEQKILDAPFVSSQVIADTLLALCHVNCRPAVIEVSSGVAVQVNAAHPILPLMEACHRLLEWELYKESIRLQSNERTFSIVGENCFASTAACGITALSQLAILRNCTSNSTNLRESGSFKTRSEDDITVKRKEPTKHSDQASSSQFYVDIFDEKPNRSDTVRAAAAQAVVCVCCAADRLKKKKSETFGLLTGLEFLLDRILDPSVSPGLKKSLAALMMDVCSGNICSMPRTAVVGGRNDLVQSVSRLVCGPLGASYGGDNGSALLMTVSETTYPAAHAVNHGALEGLRLLKQAGRDELAYSEAAVIRVAQFAAKLWRTLNGEMGNEKDEDYFQGNNEPVYVQSTGICAFHGHLRIALLAFWQKLWPRDCYAILQAQMWKEKRGLIIPNILDLERSRWEDARDDEKGLDDFSKIVDMETGRQRWRGEMASKSYSYWSKDGKRGMKDMSGSAMQGLGHPLPVVEKDKAWKMGGWSASSAQQRRKMALDGGTAVNKIRAKMKSSSN